MITKKSLPSFHVPTLVVSLWASGVSSAYAADANSEGDRPPLKLSIDRKAINREASAHVSYAPIVEQTSSSVVFVYSTKQVRVQNPMLNDPMLRRFFGIPGGPGGAQSP